MRADPGVDFDRRVLPPLRLRDDEAHASDGGVRAALAPLFDEFSVDLVVQGHNHQYERTEPDPARRSRRAGPRRRDRRARRPTARPTSACGSGGRPRYSWQRRRDRPLPRQRRGPTAAYRGQLPGGRRGREAARRGRLVAGALPATTPTSPSTSSRPRPAAGTTTLTRPRDHRHRRRDRPRGAVPPYVSELPDYSRRNSAHVARSVEPPVKRA